MKRPCIEWRRELEGCLQGAFDPDSLRALSLDPHAVSCAACRELLEEERALESMLGSLPEPEWPPAKLRALLRRLRAELLLADDPLDRLLERDATPPQVPSGIAERVLAGLAAERSGSRRELALDAVLDRLPEPEVPSGLAERVLIAVAPERGVPERGVPERGVPQHGATTLAADRPASNRPRRLVSGLPLALAAAAAVVFGLAFGLFVGAEPEPPLEISELTSSEDLPESALLDVLAVLENWDLLVEDELDVLLSSVGADDELLLDADVFAPAEVPSPVEPSRG